MKITELQVHKIDESYRNSSQVLHEIKRKALKGKDLDFMKMLESVVQTLEILLIKSVK